MEQLASDPNIIQSAKTLPPHPDLSYGKFILECVEKYGDKIYAIHHDTGKRLTFSKFAETGKRIASWLDKYVPRGEHFGICGPNSLDNICLMLGAMLAGLVVIPIRATDTVRELKMVISERAIRHIAFAESKLDFACQVQDSDFRTCIVFDSSGQNQAVDQLTNVKPVLLKTILDSASGEIPEDWLPFHALDDIAVILESSGTTGSPKGVLLSNRYLHTMTHRWPRFQESDIVANASPYAHLSGLNQFFQSAINGAQLVVVSKMQDHQDKVDMIARHNVTNAMFPPSWFSYTLKSDFSKELKSLKKVMTSGAPIPRGLPDKWHAKYGIPFGQFYGLTESGICISAFLEDGNHDEDCPLDSCGRIQIGAAVKLVDPDTGVTVGRNQEGEMCIFYKDQQCSGYHNNPKATQELWDADGWQHTGDIMLCDEQGNFFFRDRIKEMLKTNGMQVSPSELESILITHPAVQECCVTGLPDEIAGDLAAGFCILKPNHVGKVTADEIKQFVDDQVGYQKRLAGGVHFVESFPRTGYGKVQRRKLRDQFIAKLQPE